MKHTTVTQFYRFLDSLGLFGEFWSEFYKVRNGRRMTFRAFEYFSTLPPERFLTSAFPWKKTDAGYAFWERVHRRWLRRIGCGASK